MNVTLLSPIDPRWREAIRRIRSEFYQTPEYVVLEADRMDGEPAALWIDDKERFLLIPLILRTIPWNVDGSDRSYRDGVSPYGYPGMLINCVPEQRKTFLASALHAAVPHLRYAGIPCLFVRMNPILNNDAFFPETGIFMDHGSTVWIDLSKSSDELDKQTRSRFRSYIRAAKRAGLAATFDEDWEQFETFVELYHRTMELVNAAQWYFLSHDYFHGLRAALGDAIRLCLVKQDTRIVAAGLFAESGGIVQYLFSGKDETFPVHHATKLMMIHVRDWAKQRGNEVFHLGGGLGGGRDNLSQFKRGFSKLTCPFYTWRFVADREIYSGLVKAWSRAGGAIPDGESGYFPAYRKEFTRLRREAP